MMPLAKTDDARSALITAGAATLICALAVLLTAFTIYAALQLSNGHNWGDDFGLYLQTADNILAGREYNFLNRGIQSPPGFPLILAGWIKLFGSSFQVLKTINIVAWLAAASIAGLLALRLIGPMAAVFVVILHVCLPGYFILQQTINTDIPFVPVCAAILALSIVFLRTPDTRRYLLLPLIGGLLLYGLLIRPAGLPVAAGIAAGGFAHVLLHERNRAGVLAFVALIATMIAILVTNSLVFGSTTNTHFLVAMRGLSAGGGDPVSALLNSISRRGNDEWRNLNVLAFGFPVVAAQGTALIATTLVAMALYIYRVRDVVMPAFSCAYLGLVLLTPWDGGPRYLMPLVTPVALFLAAPFHLLKDAHGAGQGLLRTAAKGLATALMIVACAWLLRPSVNGTMAARGFDDNQITTPQTAEMIAFLRRETSSGSLVCSPKPRAVMYLASRGGCVLPRQIERSVGDYLIGQKAEFAVVFIEQGEVDYHRLDQKMAQEPGLSELFRNRDYVVYKLVTNR